MVGVGSVAVVGVGSAIASAIEVGSVGPVCSVVGVGSIEVVGSVVVGSAVVGSVVVGSVVVALSVVGSVVVALSVVGSLGRLTPTARGVMSVVGSMVGSGVTTVTSSRLETSKFEMSPIPWYDHATDVRTLIPCLEVVFSDWMPIIKGVEWTGYTPIDNS